MFIDQDVCVVYPNGHWIRDNKGQVTLERVEHRASLDLCFLQSNPLPVRRCPTFQQSNKAIIKAPPCALNLNIELLNDICIARLW